MSSVFRLIELTGPKGKLYKIVVSLSVFDASLAVPVLVVVGMAVDHPGIWLRKIRKLGAFNVGQ